MNILYSILLYDVQKPQSPSGMTWYDKVRTFDTSSMQESVYRLADAVMAVAGTPDEKKRLACIICNESLGTCFGREILERDPDNTYSDVGRDPEEGLDESLCAYNLTEPASSLRRLDSWLDADIRERLVVPTWFEYMAAASLQLLRMAT